MKNYRMDDIDDQILKLLSENARMSIVEISNRIGLSRVAINQRINILEQQGIIDQYSVVINTQKMGKAVSAYFDIEVEPSKIFECAQTIAQIPSITDVYVMSGKGNLHVHGLMNLNEELTDLLKDELYKIDGIISIDCKLILSRVKVRNSIRI